LQRISEKLRVLAFLVLFTCSGAASAQTEGGSSSSCQTIALEASKGTNSPLLARAAFADHVRAAIATARLTRVEPGQSPDVRLVFDETYHPGPRDLDNWFHASISIKVLLARRFLPDLEIVDCPACAGGRSRSAPPEEAGLWDAAMARLFGANGGLEKLGQELAAHGAGVRLVSQGPAEFRLESFDTGVWQPLPDEGLLLRCMKPGDGVNGTVRHGAEQTAFTLAAPSERTFVWQTGADDVRDAGRGGGRGASNDEGPGPTPNPGWLENHATAASALGLVFVIGVAGMALVARRRPTRVAFVGSSPRAGYTELLVAKEQTSLELMPRGRATTIHGLPNATFSDVVTLFTRLDPEVVHFAGHGEGQELVLQDTSGQAVLVDAAFMQRLFTTRRATRLIVLNACKTEPLARSVTRSGRVAVGWTGEMDDDAALQFTTTLYRSIFSGESVESAFKLAEVEYSASAHARDGVRPMLAEAVTGDAGRCVLGRRLGG
jgi:hypothetical protein